MALPKDGHRYELLDGSLVVNPPPTPHHQGISFRVHYLLDRAAVEASAPVAIREAVGIAMPEGNLLIPDLVVVKADAINLGKPLLEPADVLMVAGIVSPGSRRRDRTVKPYMYAEAGIPLYWRIETDKFTDLSQTLPVVVVHELVGPAEYAARQVVGAGEILAVDDPFPVKFDPAELTGR